MRTGRESVMSRILLSDFSNASAVFSFSDIYSSIFKRTRLIESTSLSSSSGFLIRDAFRFRTKASDGLSGRHLLKYCVICVICRPRRKCKIKKIKMEARNTLTPFVSRMTTIRPHKRYQTSFRFAASSMVPNEKV